jgi:hypothetical protein
MHRFKLYGRKNHEINGRSKLNIFTAPTVPKKMKD